MSLTNDNTLLQVNNLKKYFPTPHGLLYAVDNVSFNINKGDTLGVVGESGCGKSTLGRSILRLHEPTAGEVLFEGKNILSLNHAQMKHMRKDMQLKLIDQNTAEVDIPALKLELLRARNFINHNIKLANDLLDSVMK